MPPHDPERADIGMDTVEETTIDGKTPQSRNGNTENPEVSFQSRRNITQGMFDIALLMANTSQLKTVLDSDTHRHYTLLVTLLGASISAHLFSAVMLYVLLIFEKNRENKDAYLKQQKEFGQSGDEENRKVYIVNNQQTCACKTCYKKFDCCTCWKIYKLDCVATFCVFIVTVLNVFITTFGGNLATTNISSYNHTAG